MWMAPNMVTLLGFVWIVANVFLIEIAVPDMVGPVSLQQNILFSDLYVGVAN